MKIRVIHIITLLLSVTGIIQNTFGQPDPIYSQSIFNVQLANPAYAGYWSGTGYLMSARQQWLGIKNAPSTQVFTFQWQEETQNSGWGLHLLNDKVGKEHRISVLGDYSYRIRTNYRNYFLGGLRYGLSYYSNNLRDYITYDPNRPDGHDPAFTDHYRFLIPNLGVGFLFQATNYQLSFSVPQLIQFNYKDADNTIKYRTEYRNYIFSGSFIKRMNYHIYMKYSLRMLITKGVPLGINPSVDVLFYPKMWLGTFYKHNESAGITLQWVFDRQMRLGYAFEFPVTQMARYQFGTHEVMFSYEIKFTRNNWYNFRFY